MTQVQKKDFEIAVDAFVEADTRYRELQEKVLDGTLVEELAGTGPITSLKGQWQQAIEQLRDLLEERNSRAQEAGNLLRQAVQMAPTQWRGPTGKPTKIQYGPVEVSSVTGRSFNPESLLTLATKKGLLERLLQITFTDKKSGTQVNSLRQEWVIDYESTMRFLRQNKLDDVITGAYDEVEKTPQVKGIKPLTFLGDTKG